MSTVEGVTPASSRFEVVAVNGKSVGIGLTWKSVTAGRDPAKTAVQQGKKEGYELVSLCKTGRDDHGDSFILAGYVKKDEAPRRFKGLYCLGTALIGQLGPDFIASFDIGDGRYALSAAFRGAVLPTIGDKVGDAAAVRSQMLELWSALTAEGSKKPVVIAPSELNVQGCDDHRTLSEVLPSKAFKKQYELSPLTMRVNWRLIIWCGAIVGAGLVGLAVYRKYQEDQKAAAEQAEAAARARRLQDDTVLRAVEKKQGLPQPWISQPAAASLLSACRAMLDDTPLSLGGWVLESVSCQVGGASASYKAIDGTPITYFTDAVKKFTGGIKPVLRVTGDYGVVGANVHLDNDASDALRNSDEAISALQNHVQAVGQGTLQLQETTGTPPGQPPPTWNTTPFALSTKFPPDRLLRDLDLSGVRVKSVTTNLDRNAGELSWQVTGEIYGR